MDAETETQKGKVTHSESQSRGMPWLGWNPGLWAAKLWLAAIPGDQEPDLSPRSQSTHL